MSKYFSNEEKGERKLSEYITQDETHFPHAIFTEEQRKARTNYIMSIIGDVSMDEETYKLFISQFQSFGGPYNVRTYPETIQGIYQIYDSCRSLNAKGLEKIWYRYIRDLFEKYSFQEALEMYVDKYGKTDEALETYLDDIDTKADEYNKQFIESSKELNKYEEEYGKDYIRSLQYLMRSEHVNLEDVLASLPESHIIKEDEKQLLDIARRTRINIGICLPISLQMTRSLARTRSLDSYPEQPAYTTSFGDKFETSFTKQEFIESVKMRRNKIKKK